MRRLLPVNSTADIPFHLRVTPIGDLLEYHNLGKPHQSYTKAVLLVGMCMDNRNQLRIPDQFAYILRTGGGNLRSSEFKVMYAIGVGGVKHLAIIGHTQCGMVGLVHRRQQFVDGLVENAGFTRDQAEQRFWNYAPLFEIGNETDFVCEEAHRIRYKYPKVVVEPMIYRVEDNRLYLIENS